MIVLKCLWTVLLYLDVVHEKQRRFLEQLNGVHVQNTK